LSNYFSKTQTDAVVTAVVTAVAVAEGSISSLA
jgi:hypothetical protein